MQIYPETIDSHIHCGIQKSKQPFEKIEPLLIEAGISNACCFAPVEDIYDRSHFLFTDNPHWIETRKRANEYLLLLAQSKTLIPYYFVWNDFDTTLIDQGFKGVKWHRHSDEPVYNYENPLCEEFLQKIYSLKLPIVLEEEYENTLYLVSRIRERTPVIIPHMGMLNGGYYTLKAAGVFCNDQVYVDTALANEMEIKDFIRSYGSDRIIFGSDYPFGDPIAEKQKIIQLNLKQDQTEQILFKNIRTLLNLKIL